MLLQMRLTRLTASELRTLWVEAAHRAALSWVGWVEECGCRSNITECWCVICGLVRAAVPLGLPPPLPPLSFAGPGSLMSQGSK